MIVIASKMNIHEHQAKEILKDFGAPVSKGIVILSINEIKEKISKLKSKEFVLKAQIHAGGRGKAGGVKLVKSLEELETEAKKMMGKILITHQTGPDGKKVKRLYIEEASNIKKEFYLSCLVDRSSSKIAFISSTEGGMDIEKVASESPDKIITTKIDLKDEISPAEIEKIISPFKLNINQKKEATQLLKALYKILIQKDANLIEINPLIITEEEKILCLDAKMNFDDNATYRRPEILKLRDLNEEDPKEIEASKYDLAYIKLNGSIGCMVNGAGLAMATMDIIKQFDKEPANFLDLGGTANKERAIKAFKIIQSDQNVKSVLINIFGGIIHCDMIASGIIEAIKELNFKLPVVVRFQGTNASKGRDIINNSSLGLFSIDDLSEAASKAVELSN